MEHISDVRFVYACFIISERARCSKREKERKRRGLRRSSRVISTLIHTRKYVYIYV